MLSFNLGPLAIPNGFSTALRCIFIAWLSGWLIGRKRGSNPEAALFNMLLIRARGPRGICYSVLPSNTADNLWQIIDIRDGGFLLLPV